MKRIYLVSIILALLLAGGWLYVQYRAGKTNIAKLLEKNSGSRFVELLIGYREKQTADLRPLPGYEGKDAAGTGYRLVRDGKTYFAVLAVLPEPAPGTSYEAWLVQEEPLLALPAGVLSKTETEQWLLWYKSAKDLALHGKVVITQEEIVDSRPEKHVLEGKF